MDTEVTAKVIWAQGDRFQAAFRIHPGKPVVLRWGAMPGTSDSPLGKLIANRGAAGPIVIGLGREGEGGTDLVPLYIKDNETHVPLYESLAEVS